MPSELSTHELDSLRQKSLDGKFPFHTVFMRVAREVAYCPYSKFRVGCAILTISGEWIIGIKYRRES